MQDLDYEYVHLRVKLWRVALMNISQIYTALKVTIRQ